MKKTRNANGIKIETENGIKFNSPAAALEAALKIQAFVALQDYLVTSHINMECKVVEITIHFSGKPFPKIRNGYRYSTKTISSHTYYSNYEKRADRVRTIELSFKY